MLADVWPLYRLAIHTPRLTLRLPREEEIAALAELAARGVHHANERPFLTPWTDDAADNVLRDHWNQLATWAVNDWCLGLGVFHGDKPWGIVNLRARDFPVVREVTTSSWLGLKHQNNGYGTEARAGLLALAFDHLDARSARTEVFPDNHASIAVSNKLGYEPDGISIDARGDEALVSHRMRLTRERRKPFPVRVEGLPESRAMFGV